jgi:hypothetical protein
MAGAFTGTASSTTSYRGARTKLGMGGEMASQDKHCFVPAGFN